MRKTALTLALALCSAPVAFCATPGPSVYVSADEGFQTPLAAAMLKKHVPATIVSSADGAVYTLQAAPVYSKDETGAGKIARCLFADCIGMNGFSSVSVELIRNQDKAVVWAYQVRKANSGPLGIQSLSEAVAKHLKNDYLDKQK